MGLIRGEPPKVLPVVAAFSHSESLLDETPRLLEGVLGPVALASVRFDFVETAYYAPTMGDHLKKQIFAFKRLMSADQLAQVKVQTNAIEAEIALRPGLGIDRPLNLDPGVLDLGKLVLASTKDHAHRIYIGAGIFGEVTLHFRGNEWRKWPWTYPDYQRSDVFDFLSSARDYYRTRIAIKSDPSSPTPNVDQHE